MKTFRQIKEELKIPAIGQTLSRDLMPQIDSDFLKYLTKQNISYTKEQLNTKDLRSTQSEFDDIKILSLMNNNDTDPIFVSNDNYVLDGHHRWIADHNTKSKTEAYVIDLPILELLRVAKEYQSMLKEEVTHKDFGPMMDAFVSFASDKLGIKSLPKINYKNEDDHGDQPSFGGYNPSTNEIVIQTKNRHPMDVFRTLCHELVHHKQNEDGRIKDVSKEGATGSPIEDEANSMAGRLMRWFGKANPDKFALSHIVENNLNNEESLHKWFQSKSSDGKRGWVQIGGKYQGKPCARQPGQTSTPKCRSSDEAARMTKDEIKYAVAKKRREDKNQPKKKNAAKPTRVATYKEKNMNEEKDIKGKSSGKKDACYHKVKARYDVWPSAYASGALVKCRKVGADNWGKKSVDEEFSQEFKNKPENREWGTKELAKNFAETTPGQKYPPPPMFPMNPLFEKKMKFVRKKDIEEGTGTSISSNSELNVPYTLPATDGIGPETGNRYASNIYGMSGTGSSLGIGYSPFGIPVAESIQKKTLKQIREASDKGIGLLGTVEKSGSNETVEEDWQKVNRQDKTDGLSQKAVNAYRRENPGSKLKTAVTEKNPKGKRAKRRLSFCRRMTGMKKRLTSAKTARDPDSRINKALRRWNCEE